MPLPDSTKAALQHQLEELEQLVSPSAIEYYRPGLQDTNPWSLVYRVVSDWLDLASNAILAPLMLDNPAGGDEFWAHVAAISEALRSAAVNSFGVAYQALARSLDRDDVQRLDPVLRAQLASRIAEITGEASPDTPLKLPAAASEVRGAEGFPKMGCSRTTEPDGNEPTGTGADSSRAENVEYLAGTTPAKHHGAGSAAPTIVNGGSRRRLEPQFPNRASWLKDRLLERGWSNSDPSKYRGPDRKTIEKILRGEAVRNDVLEKLADALSGKHAKVSVLDIPQD